MSKHEIEGQAQLIKELRLNANTTQSYVASRLQIERLTYAKYEVRKSVPNQKLLWELSHEYGIPVQAFFEPLIYLDALHNGNAYETNDLTQEERLLIKKLRSSSK